MSDKRAEVLSSVFEGLLPGNAVEQIVLYDRTLSLEDERLWNLYDSQLRTAAYWIQASESILIVTGAGMSIGSGVDYGSETDFKTLYPGMLQYGYRRAYECMGLAHEASPEIVWGYWSQHINDMSYASIPHKGYMDLFSLCQNKDYFVLTSNVDALFEKSGFNKERIYTPQGDFRFLQCPTPCHTTVYDSKPIIETLIPLIDKKNQTVPTTSLPLCPKCSQPLVANVRGGDYFVHNHYLEEQNRLVAWVKASFKKILVVIEIGCGFNTPVVTRFPAESIARHHPNARFLRLNFNQSDVPNDLPRAIGLQSSSIPILKLLKLLSLQQSLKEGVDFEKNFLIERKKVTTSRKKEFWEHFSEHHGHFDWEIFITNLQ